MAVIKYRTSPQGEWMDIPAVKGEPFKYEDFTPEQLAALKGEKGDKGDKGDTGATGAAGRDGADGKDYVLTTADKQEIANLILANFVDGNGVYY